MRDEARTPVPPPPDPGPHEGRRHAVHALTDFIALRFGVTARDREAMVASMLADTQRTAPGYWLQLLTAMGIATLGLVLDSTAVVIGAMLIAPLMTPIVAFGMGLAIGSPLLVIRSAARVAASVVIVPLGAAAITLLTPMQELTSQMAARTSPTVLDLAIACCCAVAGVYATTRPGSDRSSTAAGTAIGMSLVPPLCVVGYGLGAGTASVAEGAGLLFIANFSAIVLLSMSGFTVLGYARVPAAKLERDHAEAFEATSISARAARRLSRAFASTAGSTLRIVMPLLLVSIVYVPLRGALAELTWELRVRTAVDDILRAMPGETVRTVVRVHRPDVSVRVVTIGPATRGDELRKRLLERIGRAAPGIQATVEVATVADARALEVAETALHDRLSAPPALAAPPPEPGSEVEAVTRDVEGVLAAWPSEQAGTLSTWRIGPRSGGADAGGAGLAVEVVHAGPELEASAATVLGRSLSRELGAPVELRDVALSTEPIVATLADGDDWLVRATSALTEARLLAAADGPPFACIDVPDDPRAADVVRAIGRARVFSAPRVHVETGARSWSLRWSTSPCTPAGDAGSDAATGGDAATGPDAGR